MKFSEESSRTIHEIGNIELCELGQISRTVQCHSCVKHIQERLTFCSCGVQSHHPCNGQHRVVRVGTDDPNCPVSFMLETFARRISLLVLRASVLKNKKDQKIQALIVPYCLTRTNRQRGKKHCETQRQQDHWKAMNARRGAWTRGKDTIKISWKENAKYRHSPKRFIDGKKIIADTWSTSRRSTSFAPHPGIRGTGTRAPPRWRATMRIVKVDRCEQQKTSNPPRTCSQVFDKNKDDRIFFFRRTRE